MRTGEGSRPDEGFSLVEVLMALALVGVTMAAAGPFFVTSFQRANQQRGAQAAVQLANSALEQVRALKGSSLLTGRGEAASRAQWATAAADPSVKPYLDTMQLAWDPLTADPNAGAAAALSTAPQTMRVSGTAYARSIFVGVCDIYVGRGTDCTDPSQWNFAVDSTKDLKFFRTVVLVTWPDGMCPGGTCTYVTSMLVARASEPTFDVHRPAPRVKTETVYFYRGQAGSATVEAEGGTLPNTFTITSLPAGLTMTPAGVISGTTTVAPGSYTVSVTVTDNSGRSDTEPLAVRVVLPLALAVPGPQFSHVDEAVAVQATATNGVAPYTYTAEDLPTGVSINQTTGAITGTIPATGSWTPKITVTDAANFTATGTYTHTAHPVLTLDPIADQNISLGNSLTLTPKASGGDGTFRWTATGLPTGMAIDANTGVVSGSPLLPGRYLPQVTVTDGINGTASRRFTLVVQTSGGLLFTSPSPSAPDQTSEVGKQSNLKLVNNGSALGLAPTLLVTGLPPGMTANLLNGNITGKPTTPGTYVVTATLTNLTPPQTSVLTFLWTVT